MLEWLRNLQNGVSRRLSRLRRSEVGDLLQVPNRGRYRSANPVYYAARLRWSGGSGAPHDYLFTGHEIDAAAERARRNPEDVPWDES